MVKIRYAGRTGSIVPTRYGGWTYTQIACDIISKALHATTTKFDNNIKFNRFDAVGGVYEVTLKCISSRGKGAKRGASGRRTVSCCYHVWGVFFEELFRLNPEIVIVSMGSRITSQSHVGWRDRETEFQCDCQVVSEHCQTCADAGLVICMCDQIAPNDEAHDEWIEEQNELSRQLQAAEELTRGATPHQDAPNTSCDNCVHLPSRSGVRCPHSENRECLIDRQHRMFERYVDPNRTCGTCMYSSQNTSNGASQCPRGECREVSGLQNWMPYAPALQTTPPDPCINCQHRIVGGCKLILSPDIALIPLGCPSALGIRERYKHAVRNRACHLCKYASDRTLQECHSIVGGCLHGSPKWVFSSEPDPTPVVVKECENCEYQYDADGYERRCFPIIGSCSNKSKWKLYQPFVFVGAPTSRYDTQMVEQDTQVEQVVEFPMLKEE